MSIKVILRCLQSNHSVLLKERKSLIAPLLTKSPFDRPKIPENFLEDLIYGKCPSLNAFLTKFSMILVNLRFSLNEVDSQVRYNQFIETF